MRNFARGVGLCVFAAIAGVATSRSATAEGGFVVVVNHSNDVASLSRSELKRAATGGTKQWDNGSVVQLGIIPSDVPETQYLASLLEMSPRDLLSRIEEQVFKGEMRRPAVLHTSAECVAFARAVPGAVCVASAQTPMPPEARVVSIR